VLNGQGADETQGGYEGYPTAVLRSMIERGRFVSALSFLLSWRTRFGHSGTEAMRTMISALLGPKIRRAILGPRRRGRSANQISTQSNCQVPIAIAKDWEDSGRGRRLPEALREELIESRLPRLLRYDDRNSMHWSIESRVPFLTTALAEFMLTLPEEYLVSHIGETKSLFRRAMREIVPDVILDRTDKIGFDVPEADLLAAAWPSIRPHLASSSGGSLERGSAIAQLDAFALSGTGYDSGLWRALNVMLWEDRVISDPTVLRGSRFVPSRHMVDG
jgi:asparagine synthase (glutamine-hydrolysing)